MTDAERLGRLFDYDLWANRTILSSLEEHDSYDKREKTLSLLYHIIGTQHHWYRRVTGEAMPSSKIWPEFMLAYCRALIDDNHRRWSELIDKNANDLNEAVVYQNSKGVEHKSMLSDIMHHIIIHGQHHRSQIAMLLRMADIPPPGTDFIFYTRELEE